MSFDRFPLDAGIRAGIQSAGYSTPTPIQVQAIPPVLSGRDLIGIAQTGTGKTAAFLLPILQRLATQPGRGVRALILAPTRELAEQTHQAIRQLALAPACAACRSTAASASARRWQACAAAPRSSSPAPAACSTLLGERGIDLSDVEVLVLDEADRMCDMGFLPDIRRILKLVPAKRQTLFFSATMPDDIRKLADSILHDPVTVQIGRSRRPRRSRTRLYPVAGGLKKQLLLAMLSSVPTGGCWSSPAPSIGQAAWRRTWTSRAIACRRCRAT